MTATGEQRDPRGRISVQTQPMFHRVFPATPLSVRATLTDMRKRFRDCVSDDTLGRLELVLAEVLNNVTEHGETAGDAAGEVTERCGCTGPAPSIHLCIVRHEGGLACAITDDGATLPEECLLPRDLPELVDGALPEGGFGWFLIQDLTHALCYYREDRRNFLAFCVPFNSERAVQPA